jgi:putative phosphoribosyl transferase
MPFRDRRDAGRQLAEALEWLRPEHPVVLGLPRGGVPVAAEVAKALGAPLDVIIVRKLGVPQQPELAMGAIGEADVRVVNADVVRAVGATASVLEHVEARERVELEARAARYRSGRPRVDVSGRTVILVDDGIATGSTARAAIAVARAQGASSVVLAVPVAPPRTCAELAAVADHVVCLEQPEPFMAVGQFYRDFSQTTDAEVVEALQDANAQPPLN